MNTVHFYRATVAVLMLLAAAVPANAVPISWNLSEVAFTDGAIATGSFDYDISAPLANRVTNWNVSTSGGNVGTFPPFTYNPGTSSSTNFSAGLPQPVILLDDLSSSRQLRMTPTLALDGLVANVPLVTMSPTLGSEECFNCSPFRRISAGSFARAPEPGTLSLLAAGILALVTRRKRVADPS